MARAKPEKEVVLTQEDIDDNPELAEAGLKAGDVGVVVDTPPEASKKNKSSVTVTWNGGTRTYSKEVHGDKFKEYAEEFAEKFNGVVA